MELLKFSSLQENSTHLCSSGCLNIANNLENYFKEISIIPPKVRGLSVNDKKWFRVLEILS